MARHLLVQPGQEAVFAPEALQLPRQLIEILFRIGEFLVESLLVHAVPVDALCEADGLERHRILIAVVLLLGGLLLVDLVALRVKHLFLQVVDGLLRLGDLAARVRQCALALLERVDVFQ